MGTCYKCKFFEQGNKNHGLCHRYPPTLFSDVSTVEDASGIITVGRSYFPEVLKSEWCGEFKESKEN